MAKENQSLSKQIEHLNDKAAALQSALETNQQNHMIQFQELMGQSEKSKREYESRLEEATSRIRNQTSEELNQIKQQTKILHQHELTYLKINTYISSLAENKCKQYMNELQASQAALSELQKTHELFVSTQSFNTHSLSKNIATLEQEIKLISFERDRLKLLYEEVVEKLEHVQEQHEKEEVKCNILRKELDQIFNDRQTVNIPRAVEQEPVKEKPPVSLESDLKLIKNLQKQVPIVLAILIFMNHLD